MMYWLCILTIFFISLFSGIFSETEGIYIYIYFHLLIIFLFLGILNFFS